MTSGLLVAPSRPSERTAHSSGARRRALLTLLALTSSLLAALGATSASAAAGPVWGAAHVAPATDYATTDFADPWDYSNVEDLMINDNSGPDQGVQSPSLANGVLSWTQSTGGYVSPVWGGYAGALRLGRDGDVPANAVDPSVWKSFSMRLYSSAAVNAGLFWFTCDQGLSASCQGGQSFNVVPGWHTYVITPGASNYATSGNYSNGWTDGVKTGIQLGLTPVSGAPQLKLDWMRLTTGSGPTVTAPSTTTGSQTLCYSNPADASDGHVGEVADTTRAGSVPQKVSSGTKVDLSQLPPGSYSFFTTTSSTCPATAPATVGTPVQIDAPPLLSITSPDPTGSTDYFTVTQNHPEDLTDPSQVSIIRNASNVSYGPLGLSAVNAGPTQNDPQVVLQLPTSSIDTRAYHRITITESYDTPFDLSDTTYGGSHGRVTWSNAQSGPNVPFQTKEWVSYKEYQTLTLDMSQPGSVIDETDNPQKPDFDSSTGVISLRWDPNEARGPVPFHLGTVKLAADTTSDGGMFVQYADAAAGTASTSTASLFYDTDSVGFNGTAVPTAQNVSNPSGGGGLFWDTHALAAGTYYPYVVVTNGVSTSKRYAGAPVVVAHNDSSVPAAPTAAKDYVDGSSSRLVWTPGSGTVLAWKVVVSRSDGTTSTSYLTPDQTTLTLASSPSISSATITGLGNGGAGGTATALPVSTLIGRAVSTAGRGKVAGVRVSRARLGAICGREASRAGVC